MDRWIQAEDRSVVAAAILDLPERERAVITLYYQGGLSLKDIGSRLGVTESRTCQLRGQAVKHLAIQLRGHL